MAGRVSCLPGPPAACFARACRTQPAPPQPSTHVCAARRLPQFDGPKEAEGTAISGSLRRKPTAAYARRVDLAAYRSLPA